MPGRLLVVTYEFPPAGGAGVQRVAKYARFLPEHGWEPVVVTSEPIEGRPLDETLLADVADVEVVRLGARHLPTALARQLAWLKRLIGRGSGEARGDQRGAAVPGASSGRRRRPLSSRLSSWLAVPDAAAYWITQADAAAVAAGARHEVDAVFASGPPFSVLVAGARAAKALRVPFVADLRDAWETNPEFRGPTGLHRALARRHERRVMRAATLVTAAAEPVVEEARRYGAVRAEHVPNGFDAREMPAWDPPGEGPLRIAFMGRFYAGHDPGAFLRGFARALDRGADLALEVVGPHDAAARRLVDELGVHDRVTFHGYLPHATALDVVARSHTGLVVLNDEACARATYPAKLYEYLGIGLPVLAVGPTEGVTPRLVERLGAGWAVAEDPDAVAQVLGEAASARASGESLPAASRADVAHLERRALASRLADLLDTLCGGEHERD